MAEISGAGFGHSIHRPRFVYRRQARNQVRGRTASRCGDERGVWQRARQHHIFGREYSGPGESRADFKYDYSGGLFLRCAAEGIGANGKSHDAAEQLGIRAVCARRLARDQECNAQLRRALRIQFGAEGSQQQAGQLRSGAGHGAGGKANQLCVQSRPQKLRASFRICLGHDRKRKYRDPRRRRAGV